MRHLLRSLAPIALLALTTSCASTNRLGEYDFQTQVLAVVVDSFPTPRVLRGSPSPDPSTDAGETVTIPALEAEMSAAAARLGTFDFLRDRLLEPAARILVMTPGPTSEADFELRVHVEQWGLTFETDGEARLSLVGRVQLLDMVDRSVVWTSEMSYRDSNGFPSSSPDWMNQSSLADLMRDPVRLEGRLSRVIVLGAREALEQLSEDFEASSR